MSLRRIKEILSSQSIKSSAVSILTNSGIGFGILTGIKEAEYGNTNKPWDSSETGTLIAMSLGIGMIGELIRYCVIASCCPKTSRATEENGYVALAEQQPPNLEVQTQASTINGPSRGSR